MKLDFRDRFSKNTPTSTQRHGEANGRFSQLCERAEKSADKFQIWLKSAKMWGNFTRSRKYILVLPAT